MEPKITLGEIINALEMDSFKEHRDDPFLIFCKKREDALKKELDIIGNQIYQHIHKPELNIDLEYWQEQKSKDCIKRLVLYSEFIVSELRKENIIEYCSSHNFFPLNITLFNSDIVFIMLNSLHGSILNDFFWIDDLPIFDMLNIINGRLETIDFKKKTETRIYQIEEFLKNDNLLRKTLEDIVSINEITINFKNDTVRSLNLLLIADIEKCVRFLGSQLTKQFKLELNPTSKEYNSLDSFLRKIPWEKDLTVKFSKYCILTCNYDPINIRNLDETNIKISLKDRLHFLRRRFSLQRNQLFHGQEEDYNYHLNSFVNASALLEVLKTCSEYKMIYTNIFENK